MMNTTVILPAAGLGSRFAVGDKASASKIEFELCHKPVFLRTIELFNSQPDVTQIILAVHPQKLEDFRFRWGDQLAFLGVTLVAGGETERWETVKLALEYVSEEATHIAVHDAARPCASPTMISRVFDAAVSFGAALPGLAMSDTVKRVVEDEGSTREDRNADPLAGIFDDEVGEAPQVHRITETVPRHDLVRVQTPQVFERGLITEAYAVLDAANADGVTDDASVAERAGHAVYVVEGDPLNLKLTQPGDVDLMEAVLAMREAQDAKRAAVQELFGDDED